MSYGKMPPQAYTKETLQEAFEWWSEQTEDLRNQIQDKDDLVGYYLKARIGKSYTPSTDKNEGFTKTSKASFSSELKGLAKNLEDFEDYRGVRPQPKKTVFEKESKAETQPSLQIPFPDLSKTLVPASDDRSQASSSLQMKSQTNLQNSFFKLDAQSKATVLRAKEALNLSSEDEALRALISLGKSKIKSIF